MQECLRTTQLTLLSEHIPNTKYKVLCRCACGVELSIRVADLLYGGTSSCARCAGVKVMMTMPRELRIAKAKKASDAATKALRNKPKPPHIQCWGQAYYKVRAIMVGAKQRCTSDRPGAAFGNYKSRGIEFRFPSSKDAALWVLENLGPPTPDRSIDRIDNAGHYEAGNLRWATREEQNRNRRAYKVSAYGERVRKLRKLRPDLHQQTIRDWVKTGRTDEEIIQRGRYDRISSSV